MKGIDISRWNGWPFNAVTEKGYKESDFVVVKATQGTSYGHTDYFAKAMARANKDGKLLGAYHYAAGNDATKEADYFVSVVKPYIGKAILVLDWEKGDNKAWGSKTWAKTFCDRVKAKTGCTPLIYTGMDGCKQCASCTSYPLWFCGYPKNANSWTVPAWPKKYTTSPWKDWSIWQFTSGAGKLDRNTTKLTKADWQKLAGVKAAAKAPAKAAAPKATATAAPKGTTLALAVDTIKGKYGTGAARQKALGSRYAEVQNFINYIAVAPATTLAREVRAGKYGDGEVRKTVLGKRYNAVQKIVNRA